MAGRPQIPTPDRPDCCGRPMWRCGHNAAGQRRWKCMICRRRGVPGQPHDPLSHKIDVGPRPICCGKPASIVSRRFSLRGNKYSVLWRCTGECRKAFQGPSAVPPRPAATCPECGHKMVKQGTKNGNQRWCCRKAEGGCGVSRYLPKEEGGS